MMPEISREALIKSLSDFILVFFIQRKESVDANSELFKETDEVDWIKIHMKFDSANESVLP